jgi:hypothetical protein
MQTILATLAVMAAVMLALGVGSLLSGRRLRGSCGGVGSPDCECDSAARANCRRTKAQASS